MGRKRKSEVFEKETTPATKVAASPESKRSTRVQAMLPVDLADGENQQSPNESETGTNVEQGASKDPVINNEQVITEKNVEHGSSQDGLVNTELDSAVQRIRELNSKGGVSPDAALLLQKVDEVVVRNLALRNEVSFARGRLATLEERNAHLKNLLKGVISSSGRNQCNSDS